ncbi:uncharacterized protein YukE [Actinoplanes octamycinicus]|uniref:Uncharacterized protein YukE n=1 Tax=Actinoplanes octamycinicus TaxID=135948 RepID=A0A7W7GUT5_9ACTN|nr:hypothetical protein [Actinoplanes octamycinicus]MBB4738685.1 uncharacterized protein YukE [Actinoplanes octamycinicus]GIE61418.1 hypothetical protein Aoc01nite_68200 [Actinoplanes octamycinicus]
MSDAVAMSRAPLAASATDTKWFEGAGVLEAAMSAKDGFTQRDYLTGFGNLGVVGLSALGAVIDPFQAVFAAGVGWLMEHLDVLRQPLDWLAGDPKEIEGHAASWRNMQERVYQTVDFFARQVTSNTAPWQAEAVTAYRAKAAGMADAVLAMGEVASAMAEATLIAGAIVGVVRNTVRDLIAEVVGASISKALQALMVVTIPKVIAEVALLVAEYTGRITKVLQRLTDAVAELGGRFSRVLAACDRFNKFVDEAIFSSVFLNSAKVAEADGYIADSEGARAAFKAAYRTFAQTDDVVYGTKARIAVDALREGLRGNSIQNGGAAGDALRKGGPTPPDIEIPQ